jgi:hypothetical protein
MAKGIEAYNVRSKQKEVMAKAKIDITSNGRYFAKGENAKGEKLCAAMGQAKAEEAIEKGWATKGENWPSDKKKK